jgi:rhodanese-related sulfurtransferase
VARSLIDRGYTEVRPLAGGFDAWVDAGYPVEEVA